MAKLSELDQWCADLTIGPESIANVRRELGLDQPFYIQYSRYLDGLLHGDLGRSYLQRTAVTTLIVSRASCVKPRHSPR